MTEKTETQRLQYVFNNIKRRIAKNNDSIENIKIELKFTNFYDFQNWYDNKKNELQNKCDYCGADQKKISELFKYGIESKGKIGLYSKRSQYRGNHLEVDRKNPHGDYSKENCSLICYFCNNDKSDIYDDITYKKYFTTYKINNKTLREIFIDDMYLKLKNKGEQL